MLKQCGMSHTGSGAVKTFIHLRLKGDKKTMESAWDCECNDKKRVHGGLIRWTLLSCVLVIQPLLLVSIKWLRLQDRSGFLKVEQMVYIMRSSTKVRTDSYL